MEENDYDPFRKLLKADLYDQARSADACTCVQSSVMRELLRRYDRQQAKSKRAK
jgi:hypothetical protein